MSMIGSETTDHPVTEGVSGRCTAVWYPLQVAGFLRPVDIQSMLLVCKDWHRGFATGLLKLKPRVLKTSEVALR